MLFYFAQNTINGGGGGGGSVSQFWTHIGSWSCECEWYEVSGKITCFFVCLIWFFTSHQQSFRYKMRVYLRWTSAKLGLTCLAQGHNAVTPVSLEPAPPQSRVKHSTTANYRRRPQFEIMKYHRYIKISIIHLWWFCVLLRYEGSTIHVSSWLIWPCHSQILTKAQKSLIFRKFLWRWHDDRTLSLSI